jgi:pimeloyl-ACP methyl ester carboxylesterase
MVTSEKALGEPPQDVAAKDWKQLQEEKRKQKIELLDLSRNSKLIVAEHSGHHIQLDEPDLVVQAIREVVAAARQGTELTVAKP